MADQVKMKSKTVFASERITIFPKGGPEEGVKGGTVVDGQDFETDRVHARELDALGRAEPHDRADLDGDAQLEPGYQVSVPQMTAQDPDWSPQTVPGSITGTTAPFVETAPATTESATVAGAKKPAKRAV